MNFTRAVEAAPGYSGICNQADLAMECFMKNYSGAIADFDRAIEINPRFAKAYYSRGLAKKHYNDHLGAIIDFTKAIEIDPEYAEAYNKRGLLKGTLGQKDSGHSDLGKAGELGLSVLTM